MNNKTPDRINVRKNDIENFKILLREKDSPFFKKDNKDAFIMAMIFGYFNNNTIPLDKKEGFIRIEYLSLEEKSLIKAIAIEKANDLKILLDKQKVYSIAEEFAAGGIEILKDAIFGKKFGSFIKKLEADLVETYEKLNIDKEK